MTTPHLHCQDELRRDRARTVADVYGLDFVEVGDDHQSLHVVFLGKAPPQLDEGNVRVDGGRRIRDVAVIGVVVHRSADPTLDDSMDVQVDKAGDFSPYTLAVVRSDAHGHPTDEPMEGFDPRYWRVELSFRAGCPSDLDCREEPSCPPADRLQPAISYLAKDYASFRQLILDRVALLMPEWRERHVPDIGIALIELLAYAGDYLSYYQDAVATEAYLGTARQRISVRRHARLVDYLMHEGGNARAWVTLHTARDESIVRDEVYFITGFPGAPASRHVLDRDDLAYVPHDRYEVFEPLALDRAATIELRVAQNCIRFHTWGNRECCLAQGATAATLVDPGVAGVPADAASGHGYALQLGPGDVLVFQEMKGPRTGAPADADPRHRQAVRLTKMTRALDPLYAQPVVEIEWSSEDALAFPLCLSSRTEAPACTIAENVSVAFGNVVLVDHGRFAEERAWTVTGETRRRCPTDCDPGDVTVVPHRFRPTLGEVPLTFAQPLPACAAAATLTVQDPRRALPAIILTGYVPTPSGEAVPTRWRPRLDLLASRSRDPDFVTEIDNAGVAHLRFGDGHLGQQPTVGTRFHARYRVGNGPAGNVGADTIRYLVYRQQRVSGMDVRPRNPLPAVGGTGPEPIEEVKRFAPGAFRKVLERAVTADDYATLASDNDRRLAERAPLVGPAGADVCRTSFTHLQRAKARLRWTGSWYEALVAIDPRGSEDASTELADEVAAYLAPYRRVGHDLVVRPAVYVALDLAITICVLPHHLRGHVEAALLDVLGTGTTSDGRLAFFHPDRWTFGDQVPVSRIVAAAQAVPGVQSVQVTRLSRYQIGVPPPRPRGRKILPPHAILRVGPFEIARLDNDPSFPEHGRLVLDLHGGR